jgi:hypothetical protein
MKSAMKSSITRPTSSQQADRPRTQLLPPLVIPQGTSENCSALVEKIIQFIWPEAAPGSESTISDQEIGDYVAVSAITLAWHFSALSDAVRRDQLLKGFSNSTFVLMVSTEAARAALTNGTTIDEELIRIGQEAGRAEQEDGDTEHRERATAILPPSGKTIWQPKADPRRLPFLAIPSWAPAQCWKRVVELLSQIDPDTRPGVFSAISDQELGERAGACHLVMCWFLGALSTSDAGDQNALRWVEEVPTLVRVMMASGAHPSIYGLRTKQTNSMRRRGRGCRQKTIFN